MQSSAMQARDVPPKLWRKAVYPPLAAAGAFFLLGWVNYISYAVFHFNLLGSDHAFHDDAAEGQ